MEETKIRPNALFFTVLARDAGKNAYIFVWDFCHWLKFNSDGKLTDIRYIGTAKTLAGAQEMAARLLPGRRIITKYCPRSCGWY